MTAATLTLSILEIVLLLFGAIILGITIHFFISSRKNLRAATEEMEKTSFARDEWKLRYFNDMEVRDKEMHELKMQLQEAEENSRIYNMELDELKKEHRLLKMELKAVQEEQTEEPEDNSQKIQELENQIQNLQGELLMSRAVNSQQADQQEVIAGLRREIHELRMELENERAANNLAEPADKPDYLEQLRQAQKSLAEHNQKINELLGNIDIIKEKEEKEREMLRNNEELYAQLEEMRRLLNDKESEIANIQQQQKLTSELSSMLDSAYSEFNTLQGKIHKLESQLTTARMSSLEAEDLREAYTRMQRDLEETRGKSSRLSIENQQLQSVLAETEDKLREANLQRQQLQKRVNYLEELNNDLQMVAETNKKLESQLRRVSELESMLNVVSEERDQLIRRQSGQAGG